MSWKAGSSDATNFTQLIWAFGRKSEKALSKVCRISLLEERSWGPKWYEKQRLACALLPRMTNLVELELDPWKILRGDNGIAYLQPLMHLRQLRVVSLHEVLVGVKRFGQDFGDLWVRVAKDLIVKGCWEPETHISAEPNHGCFICWSENPARADWNSLWRTTSTLFSQPDTVRAVHKRLGEDFNRRRIPAYTGQDPQPVDLETANEHGLEVGLIGLPVHGPEIRDRLRELRRREYRLQGRSECSELNVRRVQVQETTAVAVGDIERVVPIRARQRGCHDGYSEGFKRLDDDAVAPRAETGWRRQRREQIERQEKLSTKKEPKRVQENRKRGRCGRRGSEEGAGGGYSLEEAS
ncbi:hypothetical protein LTR09_007545 [Extremus antarcticus]|uniref:Uncharacterized protein n=1 Tax=Extremus antarcticus TaxID=702011 RepID=A0AAJ0DIU0_9PEZI|nr:hypothetical protein LTR09_007545 [Extremus antarcticus]